ncbi:unnamed protein product [Lathyrus sativus]|nr:unnamed protein product [Lathyrus sativus]
MSILINGSPTEYFEVSRGLRQGDPLSPFLFAIVAEGFARIMKNTVDTNFFREFRLEDGCGGPSFSLLRFVDDTIIIGDGSWSNL